MVNRIIPYLGRMPHVLHRLDMFTSGGHTTLLPHPSSYFSHQHMSAKTSRSSDSADAKLGFSCSTIAGACSECERTPLVGC
jgi:hypothetical protein